MEISLRLNFRSFFLLTSCQISVGHTITYIVFPHQWAYPFVCNFRHCLQCCIKHVSLHGCWLKRHNILKFVHCLWIAFQKAYIRLQEVSFLLKKKKVSEYPFLYILPVRDDIIIFRFFQFYRDKIIFYSNFNLYFPYCCYGCTSFSNPFYVSWMKSFVNGLPMSLVHLSQGSLSLPWLLVRIYT